MSSPICEPRERPYRTGRPTKRTAKLLTELLESIEAGAPFKLACAAAGVHYDTFNDWRHADPELARQVEQVAAKGAIARLKKIERHGEENWNALAWMLERRYPQEFSRPEVQLNLAVQNNLNTGTNRSSASGSALEIVVVKDLEFLKLREHPDYEHHLGHRSPAERVEKGAMHEVETESVPQELNGSLTRLGYPGGLIISEREARALAQEAEATRQKVTEMLEAYLSRRGQSF